MAGLPSHGSAIQRPSGKAQRQVSNSRRLHHQDLGTEEKREAAKHHMTIKIIHPTSRIILIKAEDCFERRLGETQTNPSNL
jgi:hypothetical protein